MLTCKFSGCTDSWDSEGRQKVWTDGSSTLDHATGKRKAGAGIYYGESNPKNRGIRVKIGDRIKSRRATNQRAELAAVLHLLETDSGPLRIITDSMYVHLGVTETRHRWRQQAWLDSSTQGRFVRHADLWRKLDRLLCQRPKHSVVTQWTKGHARPAHVREGLTTELDTWGNTGADGLAGKAAECTDMIHWPGQSAELRIVKGPRPGVDQLTEKKVQPITTTSDKGSNNVGKQHEVKETECDSPVATQEKAYRVDPAEEELWEAI